MKLALVTAKYPYGGKESYLHAELRALRPYFERIAVFPTSPTEPAWGFTGVAADVERHGSSRSARSATRSPRWSHGPARASRRSRRCWAAATAARSSSRTWP